MKYEDYILLGESRMKPFGKKKASKVTFKMHRKHKMQPKEEQKTLPGSVTGLKPEDVINRIDQQG